jgi:opacity protein-like surface antigen
MKKTLTVVALLLLAASLGFGQGYVGGFNYQVSFPLSNMKDFIGKTSWVGFGIEGRKFVKPSLSLGVSFQWNAFREEVRNKAFPGIPTPYDEGGVVIDHNRDTKAYPLLATAHFYLRNNDRYIPYAGVGIGAIRVHQSAETSLDTFSRDEWLLGLAPEIGFIARLGEDFGLLASIKYYHGFKSGEMPSQSFFTVGIGFLWVHYD